jgi:hypothetical protein
MTTCGGTAFELWTDEMALSIGKLIDEAAH